MTVTSGLIIYDFSDDNKSQTHVKYNVPNPHGKFMIYST